MILFFFNADPKKLLQTHSDILTEAISTNLYRITNALYTQKLIPPETKEEISEGVLTKYRKATKLMNVLEHLLESSLDSKKRHQNLTDICNVLIKQEPQTLRDIAKHILQQLGKYIFMSNMPCIVTVIR